MENDYVLRTNEITKKYHYQYAVNQVSMNIKKGDIYGFVGENGAGKTTIIRLISGLANLSSGEFSLFGVKNTDQNFNETKRHIAAIVESPSIYLNLSAYLNLKIQCDLVGASVDSIPEIIKLVGLSSVLNSKKKAKDFSLGMRQRLGIAMSLVSDPDFIILDEPMNGLDPEGIVGMRNLLLDLNKKGKTILISSHILDELSKIATRYGFIHNGRLIKEISQEDLLSECKKSVRLGIDNLQENIDAVIKLLNVTNYKAKNNTLEIYDDVKISDCLKKLILADYKVIGATEKDESIEHYYLNLIGGKVYE